MIGRSSMAIALMISVAVTSCRGDRKVQSDSVRPRVADSASLGVHSTAALDSSAREILAFLRGNAAFDGIRLADSVVLLVSPEGAAGGLSGTAYGREQLRDPASWVIRPGRQSYALAPPPGMTRLTTKVGSHYNCLEYPLSSRFPDLAKLPHVGAKLEPNRPESCLQSWNVTFVFHPTTRPPRLIAAVYDQWEW